MEKEGGDKMMAGPMVRQCARRLPLWTNFESPGDFLCETEGVFMT